MLSEVGVDSPVSLSVGIGQCVAGDTAPKFYAVMLRGMRSQSRFDVAETLPERELGERKDQKLVQTRKGFDLEVATIPTDRSLKRRTG